MKKNVLSCFDGMSCCQISLNNLGIEIDNYFSSEIDVDSIKVTLSNFPNTKQLGDIRNITTKDLIKKCSGCGTKVKDNYKFCPQCGNQVVRTKTEIHYTTDNNVSIGTKLYTMVTYRETLDNFLKKNENKLIYIQTDSLRSNGLRAIVID